MEKQTILITGGAGFIGSNFVHHMVAKYPDYTLVIIDKLTYAGNLENIQSLVDAGAIEFVLGDISDSKLISNLFKHHKFTAVVNFAAETHVDRSIKYPNEFVQTNIVGTHTLLAQAREHGVQRFHQVSTDEVYGDLGTNSTDFFTESTPLAPNCPYAASKAAADLLVRSYYETYGMHVSISRCSNNYGPYQFPEKLIPRFFQLASDDKPLPLFGDGKNVRDWLYVADHCQAIDLILHKAAPGSVYNVGGHNEKENIEIAQLILEYLGKSKDLLTFIEDRKAHDRRYAIDPAKLEKDLGWEPRTNFHNGIKMTFEWYQQNEQWWKNLVERASIERTQAGLKTSASKKSSVTTHK